MLKRILAVMLGIGVATPTVAASAAQLDSFFPFPSAPFTCDATVAGFAYYDTGTSRPYVCDGTAWQDMVGLPSVAFPLLSPDPASIAQAEATIVPAYSWATATSAGLFWYENSISRGGLKGRDGSGVDQAGSDLLLNTGVGTGTGAGGVFRVRVHPPGAASGSTHNTRQDALTLASSSGAVVMGGVDVLTTAASTLAGADIVAGQTDAAGGGMTVRAGQGTGTGAGGTLNFQVAPPASSTGTTQNAAQTLLQATATSTPQYNFGNLVNTATAAGASTISGYNRATGVTDGTTGGLQLIGGRGTGTGAGGNITAFVATPAASTGTAQNANQSIFTLSGANGLFVLGGVDTAVAAGTSTLAGVDRSTTITDGAAGGLVIRGGQGTGTGNGGNIALQVAIPAASTGTAQNALATIGTLSGTNGSVSLGGVDVLSGASAASSLQGVDAATGRTDIAGGTLNLNGGQGTGTGVGGSVNLQVASAGTTGSSQNALTTRLTADTVGAVVPSGQWLRQPSSRTRTSAAFNKTTSTALATVTGLSVNVLAGRSYSFEARLFVDADVTGGSKYAINGTATATAIIYHIDLICDATSAFVITSRQTALAGSVGQAGCTAGLAIIRGTITVNAAGTLLVEFAQNAASGTSTVLAGSTFTLEDLGA